MGGLIDGILGLSGVAAYTLVALLAFGEAAAFVGLVVPGELAVLLGGVLANQGNASLSIMLVAVVLAAIAGDSVGYEMGKRLGPRLVSWPPLQRRFGDRIDEASDYLQHHGGRAVFLGRWTSVLRALLPGLAGMARMPYRRFLIYNVAGGIAWGTTFVLLGYAAGASWRTVERVAGRASLLLLGVVALVLVARWATRRLVARADEVRRRLDRIAATPPVRWARHRFAVPLTWASRRLAPGATRGLGWTVSLVVAGGGAWLVGVAVQDLLAREELALLDGPVAAWVGARTTPAAVAVADVVHVLTAPPWGVWLVAALAALVFARAGRAAGGRVVVAALLAAGLSTGLAALLPSPDAGFPSVSVAWLTAAVVAALPALGADGDLRPAIRLGGIGAAVVLVSGTASLVTGTAAVSGLVGGVGIGLLLGIGGELTARTVDTRTDGPDSPDSPDSPVQGAGQPLAP